MQWMISIICFSERKKKEQMQMPLSWRYCPVLGPWDTHFLYTVRQSNLVDSGTDHHCDDTCHHSDTCNADCSSCHMYQQGRQWSSFCLSNPANTDRHLNKHISTNKLSSAQSTTITLPPYLISVKNYVNIHPVQWIFLIPISKFPSSSYVKVLTYTEYFVTDVHV
jgi:hypothetical protein